MLDPHDSVACYVLYLLRLYTAYTTIDSLSCIYRSILLVSLAYTLSIHVLFVPSLLTLSRNSSLTDESFVASWDDIVDGILLPVPYLVHVYTADNSRLYYPLY
jgi:hypothetical protein